MPKHDTWSFFLRMDEVHFAAELAMVAFFGLLELFEVGGELSFGRPSSTVDALQLRPLGVAAPVGTGKVGDFEGLADLSGRSHVWATAQIEPVTLLIDVQGFTLGDRVDELDLE